MTGTVITDLRRRGAVDPSRVLTGPLRVVGLQWLDPGRSTAVAAEGVERALYVTAGSGTATVPGADPGSGTGTDSAIPLVEGTAVTLPLGARTVLTAGTAGLEYFHAVLSVAGRPGGPIAHPAADRPTAEPPAPEPPAPGRPATGRPAAERPATGRPARQRDRRAADHPDRPDTPPSPKGGEPR
ncbi:hypothetical protein ACFCX4_26025 [Kitasatospora sp. NPDC056327]|uniref:hypothetical protein n=1 Tax=Kitasatospora sp. NPDC056327 TaxID=3345785 RepID=UPI0035E046CB